MRYLIFLIPLWVYHIAAWTLCLIWAIKGLSDIATGRRRIVSFLLLLHFVLLAMPLLFDVVFGAPPYQVFPGFRLADESGTVALIYDAFLCCVPSLWWYTGRRPKRGYVWKGTISAPQPRSRVLKVVLWTLLISPVAILSLAPDLTIYLRYAEQLQKANVDELQRSLISVTTLLSIVAGAGLLIPKKDMGPAVGLICIFLTVSVWLNGKRSAVALTLALVALGIWAQGRLTLKGILFYGSMAVVLFMAYCYWYQATLRPAAVYDANTAYDNMRVDFGRDRSMKLVMYSETYPEQFRVLDYRGESLLFYLTLPVPRLVWGQKPWPYSVYATAAALRAKTNYVGWGVTTCWLDEAIANLGWPGLLIGPLFLSVICLLGDEPADPFLRALTVLVLILLMTVEFSAWALVGLLWIVVLFQSKTRLRKFRVTEPELANVQHPTAGFASCAIRG